MLLNITPTFRERARQMLTFLCFSTRPLTVSELIDAVAVDVQKDECYDRDRKLQDSDDLLRVCPGLISITTSSKRFTRTGHDYKSIGRTKIVRIPHFSVQEYLLSSRIQQGRASSFAMSAGQGHFQISKSCLVYLRHEDFLNQALTRDLISDYPLARFAAEFWHHHYRLSDASRVIELEDWLTELFRSEKQLERYVRLCEVGREYKGIAYEPQICDHGPPIHYVAQLGLDTILANILSIQVVNVNARGGLYHTALHAACDDGHEKVVQMLVDAGADVNARGGFYETALQAASSRGHEKVVQMLIDAGADVNARGGHYNTALQAASRRGYKKVVQMLLKKGAKWDEQL